MVKTVEEIYQEMLSAYGEKTGVAPAEGCDLSARLYACAAQVFSLYVQAGWVARQLFPRRRRGSIWTATPSSGGWSGRSRWRRGA